MVGSTKQGSEPTTHEFIETIDVSTIMKIAQSRLPMSCHVVNMLTAYDKWTPDLKLFTMDGILTDDAWILLIYDRKDFGRDTTISAPKDAQPTEDIKQLFLKSPLFNWSSPYWFSNVPKNLSSMIYDISNNLEWNVTTTLPALLYYISPSDVLKQESLPNVSPPAHVKRLDNKFGVKFIQDTWKFGNDESLEFIQQIIDRNESVGVYLHGKPEPVCGLTIAGYGLMSMLYTEMEHRGKGYAKMCMQTLMRAQAQKGMWPCCTVEAKNRASYTLMESLGMQVTHAVDFIWLNKLRH